MGDLDLLARAFVAFFAFGLFASSAYVVNDLVDATRDRVHPSKRHRPIASGALGRPIAWSLAAALFALGLALAAGLGELFLVHVAAYWALSVGYTLWLKRIAVLDVLALASLYTVRVFSGSVAVDIVVSNWLLAFSMFLFLSLALLKRTSELRRLGQSALESGRGYRLEDEPQLGALGSSAGYVAVLVLALYVNGEAASMLYARPQLLWLLCPVLLYWMSRAWLLANRGVLDDDPVVFALRDRASWAVVAIAGAILVAATW